MFNKNVRNDCCITFEQKYYKLQYFIQFKTLESSVEKVVLPVSLLNVN